MLIETFRTQVLTSTIELEVRSTQDSTRFHHGTCMKLASNQPNTFKMDDNQSQSHMYSHMFPAPACFVLAFLSKNVLI